MVILGNENGTIGEPIISLISSLFTYSNFPAVVDFNNDSLLDIVLEDNYPTMIHVFLGNGDGTFHEIMFFIENCSYGIHYLSVGNLNNDRFLDFAVVCSLANSINIIFGNANGTFPETISIDISTTYFRTSVDIADFNGDNYGDIVYNNGFEHTFHVRLGHGNGSFDMPKISLIGRYLEPTEVFASDFNADKNQDLMFVYQSMTSALAVGLMFGYNDGTFSLPVYVNLKILSNFFFLTPSTKDFNNDGHLDLLIFSNSSRFSTLNIYFGDGNGNFELYTIYGLSSAHYFDHAVAGDFNGDGYQDIFTTYDFSLRMFLNTGQCDNASEILNATTSIY